MTSADFDRQVKLMAIATEMANAVAVNLPDTLPIDPDTTSPEVTTANGMVFRLTRTFYAWLVASMSDPTYWPPPPAVKDATPAGGPPPGLAEGLKAAPPAAIADTSVVDMLRAAGITDVTAPSQPVPPPATRPRRTR